MENLKDITGNLMRFYPMLKNYLKNSSSHDSNPNSLITRPLFQKVQKRHLKRIRRIKNKLKSGAIDRQCFRYELKEAHLVLIIDFSKASEIALKRIEKFRTNW
jgi:hypothetical protein